MVAKSTWSFPCPCKSRENLPEPVANSQVTSAACVLVDCTKMKIEKAGIFHTPAQGGNVFENMAFELNPEFRELLHFSSPFRVFLEITELCNLKCQGCYAGEKSKNRISMENVRRILDDLRDSGTLGVQLLGGEPTIHPDFVEICRYAKAGGLNLEVVSNGMILNREMVADIPDSVDIFSISMDGPKEIQKKSSATCSTLPSGKYGKMPMPYRWKKEKTALPAQ